MPVTVEEIKRRTNEQTYQRGLDIYRDPKNPLLDPVRRGDELEAYYQGSGRQPYHIVVELDGDSVKSAECTCGYKRGDDCKHIVALLTAYVLQSDIFEARAAEEDPLLHLGRDELIELVRQMLVRYPDLQILIEEPEAARYTPDMIDIGPYREQLEGALRRGRNASDTVYDLAETAERFADQGNYLSAAALYQMILAETLQPDHTAFDESGSLLRSLGLVIDELGKLLRHLHGDDTVRQSIVESLLDAFIWEHNSRFEGLTEEVPEVILAYSDPVDVPALQDRIKPLQQAHLAEGRLQIANTFANLLTYLEALKTDPKLTLTHLRNQGMYTLLFYRLLQMGDVAEASGVARQHITEADDFLDAMLSLIDYDERPRAIQVAASVLKELFNDVIAGWLVNQYRQDEQFEEALKLQRQRMAQHPTLGNYLQLKELAGIMGRWGEIRPRFLQWLGEHDHYETLTEIHLEEQDWAAAWETLEQTKLSDWRYRDLAFEVAEQSRFAMPGLAIPVYLNRVEDYIQAKTRANYQQAAELLKVVRQMHHQLNQDNQWQETIDGIREKHSRLSALLDELEKAALY